MAARVVLPPSGTTLLFAVPRNAVAARLTCRKRFRPIYSCSRIRMDYSPASLRPGEPSVNRVHSPRRARSRATRANVGTPLEPFASLRTLEEPHSRISCWNFNGLIGGRTRTRTLDPLIKSQRLRRHGGHNRPALHPRRKRTLLRVVAREPDQLST